MTYGCVIASYKYGHLASHCIESVLEQTKPFDEVWFVDDGAKDCGHLPRLYPTMNYVFRSENIGTVANFQSMLEKVGTDKVMFLGADNWLRPDALELLSKKTADIVMYDIQIVGTEKEWAIRQGLDVKEHEGGYYWNRCGKHHGSMLYSVNKAREVGYFSDNKGNTTEDLNLFVGMLKNNATVEHAHEALLYYRRHKNNFNEC